MCLHVGTSRARRAVDLSHLRRRSRRILVCRLWDFLLGPERRYVRRQRPLRVNRSLGTPMNTWGVVLFDGVRFTDASPISPCGAARPAA